MSIVAVGAITDEAGGATATINTYTPTASNMAGRNLLFNSDFRINQRVYVSAATLASGTYGHDRFKSGASGGDYSFTQLNSSTQVTIASGKSLIQVVEDKNVVGGSYVLSWTGTAEGRVGVDSATPAGAFAVSPILITGQTAGTTMSVEFDEGTLGTIQLEEGSVATPFEHRSYGTELALCQRYLPAFRGTTTNTPLGAGYCPNSVLIDVVIPFVVPTRADVTGIVISAAGDFSQNMLSDAITAVTINSVGNTSCNVRFTTTGVASFQANAIRLNTASAFIYFTGAEL